MGLGSFAVIESERRIGGKTTLEQRLYISSLPPDAMRLRLDPIKRKGGLKARRLIASTSDNYRAQLLGLL